MVKNLFITCFFISGNNAHSIKRKPPQGKKGNLHRKRGYVAFVSSSFECHFACKTVHPECIAINLAGRENTFAPLKLLFVVFAFLSRALNNNAI